ncbi:MAG: AEC family transporter [Thalassobaculales bacterium]
MDAILNVAVPVFAIILAGYLAGRSGVLSASASQAINGFVYWFALPPLLFHAMAKVPLAEVFNGPFLAAYSGGVLGTFALSMIAGILVFRGRPAELTLQGQTAIFANTGYMGVPLFLAAFGQDGLLPAIILTVYNGALVIGISVVLIELDLLAGERPQRILGGVALSLLKNPLVMSTALGIFWSAVQLPVPTPVANFCQILGASAGPSALFAMGLFLVGKPLAGDMVEISWLVVLKLLVQPAITWWLAVAVMDLDEFWAVSAVIMAALPTGALTFTLAQRYGIYVRRATAATLLSTVLSVITLSALLAWLGVG